MKRIFSALTVLCILLSACGCAKKPDGNGEIGGGIEKVGTMELSYATQFSVEYYAGGYKLIALKDGSRFLVVPEGMPLPQGISRDIVPLYQPIRNIYLAATSAMCLFDALDRLDAIRLSGTRADGWYIDNAVKAMQEGSILYAGKYSEPDYEMILENDCSLAIESTMIGHASEVKDKLESLGVSVLVDQSSLESHPLGRTEWIRLYGALFNEEDRAAELFLAQKAYLDALPESTQMKKTVAFFHISSSGLVIARKSGDYVSKMLALAGGKYIFDDLGDPEKNTATTAVEMETFYARAKDADYIIYNSTIGGELHSLDEFLQLNDLLKNFKAVQNGHVWCTGKNMFQETMELGQMIQEFHVLLTQDDPPPENFKYLYKLQ